MATKKNKRKSNSKKVGKKSGSLRARPPQAKSKKKPTKTKKAKSKTRSKSKAKSNTKSESKAKAKTKSKSKAKVKPKTQKKESTKTSKLKAKKKVAKGTKSKKKKNAKFTKKLKPSKAIRGKLKVLEPALQKIRQRLIRERQELYNILQSSKELERSVSELNFSNEIDLAASLEGREMAFQLSSRDRNELKLIEEALFHISAGTYGICQSCSKTIGMKRLQIMPLTTYCINCQETMERPS